MMTAVGAVRLSRWQSTCLGCAEPGFTADRRLGLDGYLTARARRMACRAGLNSPFRTAEGLLRELSGWAVDAETIRRLTHTAAGHAARTRGDRTGRPDAFAGAAGDHEVQIDAGKVNTPDGWRDVTVAGFAVRGRGPSASSADDEQRDRPAPGVRSVVAAVEEVGAFGPRCRAEADRLGVPTGARVTVLGDGAEWVWNLAGSEFVGGGSGAGLLPRGRVPSQGGSGLTGGGRPGRVAGPGPGPVGRGRYLGACEAVGELPGGAAEIGAAVNDWAGHRDRVNYAVRLHRGQAIGSGLVEGTITQRVNLRVKRTGARWRAAGVGPFVELLAMSDTPEWAEYWNALAV
ncbi:MAG TPA: ISKra4 family transposase [Urbifossiella sp.]|nr:ISKra4 family transposase [Urbifossiella sp.]